MGDMTLRGPTTKRVWPLVALAIMAFDGWFTVNSLSRMPSPNSALGREEVCAWAEERFHSAAVINLEPGPNPYPRCMAEQYGYQSALEQRQEVIDQRAFEVTVKAAGLAIIPVLIGLTYLSAGSISTRLFDACVEFVLVGKPSARRLEAEQQSPFSARSRRAAGPESAIKGVGALQRSADIRLWTADADKKSSTHPPAARDGR